MVMMEVLNLDIAALRSLREVRSARHQAREPRVLGGARGGVRRQQGSLRGRGQLLLGAFRDARRCAVRRVPGIPCSGIGYELDRGHWAFGKDPVRLVSHDTTPFPPRNSRFFGRHSAANTPFAMSQESARKKIELKSRTKPHWATNQQTDIPTLAAALWVMMCDITACLAVIKPGGMCVIAPRVCDQEPRLIALPCALRASTQQTRTLPALPTQP